MHLTMCKSCDPFSRGSSHFGAERGISQLERASAYVLSLCRLLPICFLELVRDKMNSIDSI